MSPRGLGGWCIAPSSLAIAANDHGVRICVIVPIAIRAAIRPAHSARCSARSRCVNQRRSRLGEARAALAFGAPALMGAYRVLADDHWTTDVIGGWMLGGAMVTLTCLGDAAVGDGMRKRSVTSRRPCAARPSRSDRRPTA